MNDNKPRYHVRAFCPGRWHVHDRENFNLPIYNTLIDKPALFDDIDKAFECADRLNQEHSNKQHILV